MPDEHQSQAVIAGQRGMATIEAMLDMDLSRLIAMSQAEMLEYIRPALETQTPITIDISPGGTAVKQATRVRIVEHIDLERDGKIDKSNARRMEKIQEKRQGIMDLSRRTLARAKTLTPIEKQDKFIKDLAGQLGMEDEVKKYKL